MGYFSVLARPQAQRRERLPRKGGNVRRSMPDDRRIDPRELEEAFRKSPSLFIEWALSVVPMEGGKEIPFKLNPGQRKVMDILEDRLPSGDWIRLIILKSRRQGISTLCEAVMYWLASCFANQTTMVLAHDKDTSSEIFRMAQGFYETDRRHRAGIIPALASSNEHALRFGNPDRKTRHIDPGLRSSMLVETAEGKGVGRGLTLMGYHWAEVAYTVKQDVSTGLNIACSKVPGSIGIWESTANGIGDAFESNWHKAVAGENDFTPIFLPWNIDPRCKRKLTTKEYETWHYYAGEEALEKEFGLTKEQLKFRRITIASPECFRPGVPPEDVFRQEYPLTPEEAFIKQGKNFFLIPSLNSLRTSPRGAREPVVRASIRTTANLYTKVTKDKPPIFIDEQSFGPLLVWEKPLDGVDYVVGGDPSAGLQQDASVAIVLKRPTVEVVAKLYTKNLDPDEFGLICSLIGWWYNTALVGVERNGAGAAANKAIRLIHYPRPWYDRDIVNINEPVKSFMGWNTNASSRRPMLDRLEEAVRKAEIGIPSQNFYDEARTFVFQDMANSNGSMYAKPVAAPGCHDDEIIAIAIALQLHLHGGSPRGVKAEQKPTVDIYKPTVKQEKKVRRESPYDWYHSWDT